MIRRLALWSASRPTAGRGSTSWRGRGESANSLTKLKRTPLSVIHYVAPGPARTLPHAPPPLDEKCPPSPPRPCLSTGRPPRRARALPRSSAPPAGRASAPPPPCPRLARGVKDHLDRGSCWWTSATPRSARRRGTSPAGRTSWCVPNASSTRGRSERRPRAARVLLARDPQEKTHEARTEPGQPPVFEAECHLAWTSRDRFYGFRAKTRVKRFSSTTPTSPSRRHRLAARGDEDGTIHMNPNFLAQIRQEFPNSMSRILIACDDARFARERGRPSWTSADTREGTDGGIDAYLAAFPLGRDSQVGMRPEIGETLRPREWRRHPPGAEVLLRRTADRDLTGRP